MEVLYFVEVDGNVTFHEVAIAYLDLTLCRAFILGDIAPMSAKGLSPRIRMYLGI